MNNLLTSDYKSIADYLSYDSGMTNNVYDRDQWDDFYENNSSDQSNESIVTYSKTNPNHYQHGRIEVWDFVVDQQLDFLAGNVIKYICRAGHKNHESELDDWLKAKAYVERKIQQLSHERNR